MQKFKGISVLLVVFMLVIGACSPTVAQTPQERYEPEPTSRPVSTQDMTQVIDEAVEKAIAELLAGAEEGPKAPAHPLLGAPTISEEESFIRFLEKNLNSTWSTIYPDNFYTPTVRYVGQGPTYAHACAGSPSDVAGGPVYCPADDTVYFTATKLFDYRLTRPLAETGDFAIAYLLAHEYGHHIQQIFDIEKAAFDPKNDFGTKQQRGVKYELQADCFAGVWANSVYYQGYLEKGDIEEAIEASTESGDDVMSDYTLDESQFTHGYGRDRYAWFMYGYNNGKPELCNPFTMGMSPPSQPQVVNTPVPETNNQGNAVTDFFKASTDIRYCQTTEDGSDDTVLTVRCTYNENFHADFDQWISEPAVVSYVTSLRDTGNLTYDDSWKSSASGKNGQIIAYNSKDGSVVVIWTVWGTALTGTAVLDNSTDLDAVFKWFDETGSVHFYQK